MYDMQDENGKTVFTLFFSLNVILLFGFLPLFLVACLSGRSRIETGDEL
jgi:hypothetical protein